MAHNNYISKEIFKEYHFLYYNKSICDFNQELPLTPNDDLIADYLNRADIIVLMATEANHNWFQAVREKAILNRLNLIQQLRADAIWVLQHP